MWRTSLSSYNMIQAIYEELSRSQSSGRRSMPAQAKTIPFSLRGLRGKKVNIELFKEFYVKNIPVKLQHNAGNVWGVIKLNGSLTLSYTESSKTLHKNRHKTWLKCWCGKNTRKATTWYMQFLSHLTWHYHIHKGLQHAAIWPWPSSNRLDKGQH